MGLERWSQPRGGRGAQPARFPASHTHSLTRHFSTDLCTRGDARLDPGFPLNYQIYMRSRNNPRGPQPQAVEKEHCTWKATAAGGRGPGVSREAPRPSSEPTLPGATPGPDHRAADTRNRPTPHAWLRPTAPRQHVLWALPDLTTSSVSPQQGTVNSCVARLMPSPSQPLSTLSASPLPAARPLSAPSVALHRNQSDHANP